MSEDLRKVLDGLPDLTSTDRQKSLISLWLSNKDHHSAIQAELDSRIKKFEIVPHDYAIVLRVSRDISWALSTLRAYRDKKIVTVAIDVLEMTWKENPSSFSASVGGIEGISDLVDNVLPQMYVVRIFRMFGRSSPLLPEHTAFVDELFRKIFPAFGSATSLVRHASLAVDHALTAASLDVIRTVLHCWQASSVHIGTWTKLAERRPEIVKQILLDQFKGLEPSPETGRLDNPNYLLSVINVILHQEKDFEFWDSFLTSYTSYLSQNPLLPKADQIITNLDSAFLLRIAAIILQKSMKTEDKFMRVMTIFDLLRPVMDRHREDTFDLGKLKEVIELACEEFGRSRWKEFWIVASPEQLESFRNEPNIIGLLLAVFKHLNYAEDTFKSGVIHSIVKTLPRKAIFPFCHILHASKTGESLAEAPVNIATFPSFPCNLLALLHPQHGRPFFKVGMKTLGEGFTSDLWLICESDADAESLISASWVGAEKSIMGDLGHVDQASAKSCVAQVKMYRDRASRAKQSERREYNSKMALLICKFSHSPDLFAQTISWVFTRYAKDPETGPSMFEFLVEAYSNQYQFEKFLAGPVGLYVSNRLVNVFSLEALAAWCTKSDEALKSVMKLFRVWINEPNHGQSGWQDIISQYQSAVQFFSKVLIQRIRLIEQIHPTLSKDDQKLRTILLEPMSEIFLDLERFKVIENPDVLGFDLDDCLPQRLEELIQIPRRLSQLVTPFLVDFGKKREDLYKEGRTKLGDFDTERLMQRYSQNLSSDVNRLLLPCRLILTRTTIKHSLNLAHASYTYNRSEKKHLLGSVDLSHGLSESVESQLFDDLDATLGSAKDPLADWAPNQFPEALHIYLRASPDKNHLVDRISNLFDRYERTEGGHNLAVLLLQSKLVTTTISEDAGLFTRVVGPWLPQYPPHGQGNEAVTFNLFDHMPPVLKTKMEEDGDKNLLKAMQSPTSDTYQLGTLKSIFQRPGSYWYSHPAQANLPIHISRRIAVLAIAWILQILEIPIDSEEVLEVEDSDDPVTYAIRYVRVSATTITETSKDIKTPLLMLSLVLPILKPEKLSVLLRIVFSVEMEETKMTLAMQVLHVVRRLAHPGLGLDEMWKVVNLPAMSSWHRMALTNGTLRSQGPDSAKVLIQKLLEFNQEGQRSRRKPSPEGTGEKEGEEKDGLGDVEMADGAEEEGGGAEEEDAEAVQEEKDEAEPDAEETKEEKPKEPVEDPDFFKVTTEKMVMQILGAAQKHGVVSFDDIKQHAENRLLSVSPAVFSSASDVLVPVVIQTWLLFRGEKPGIWEPLLPYIKIAQRLSESQEVTDEKWATVKDNMKVPMPFLVEEYSVATSLIRYNLPTILRPSWAKNVVEPILLGHVSSRTKWLVAAVTREGGDEDLQKNIVATYSTAIEFSRAYREYAPWFTYETVGDQEPVIGLIRRRVAPTSSRVACQQFVDLVEKNHEDRWRGTVYGTALVSLTAYGTRDQTPDGEVALNTALLSPLADGDIIPSWLADILSTTLTSIAVDLLRPENIMFDPRNDPTLIVPLDGFTRFFSAHSSKLHSSLIGELCAKYLEEAQAQELIKSSQGLHGGATYWKTIVVLKIALSFKQKTLEGLLGALADVVSTVADDWYHALHLPGIVETAFVFPTGHVLSSDIANLLRKFTELPYCPKELGVTRSLTFQTALAVLKANSSRISAELKIKGEVDSLILQWKKHEDGAVRWLADSFSL